MYYLDVVEQFDVIQDVDVNHRGYEVVVHGMKNGKYHKYRGKFTSTQIGNSFAEKVKDFVGIEKTRTG